MRTFATLGILLLAGCASTPPPPPPPPPPGPGEFPPLCLAAGGNPSEVRIDVDSSSMKVNPKECRVASGTRIVWREHGGVVFEVDFPDHTPDSGNIKHFSSKPTGTNQDVEFKVKKVWFQHHYGYDVVINGTKLDPAIIVDPH